MGMTLMQISAPQDIMQDALRVSYNNITAKQKANPKR